VTTLLIDGRSGSGKTELARAVLEQWPEAQLVRMDDLYPGWDGLAAGSASLPEVLTTHRWRRWDWATGRWAERHTLAPTRPIVVEGVGCLTRASRPLADLALWVEADEETRRSRALARDAYFAPHWESWAAQEQLLLDREQPAALADVLVVGHEVAADAVRWRRCAEAAGRD
jgi:hypothetical protein